MSTPCQLIAGSVSVKSNFEEKMEKLKTEKKMKTCSKCPYKGINVNMERHMERHHKACPYCLYETENASVKLNIHIKENHPDLDPIESDDDSVPNYPTEICRVCSKLIPSDYYGKHYQSNHNQCNFCTFFTKDFKDNLNNHLLSVHPEKVSESNPHWIETRPKFKNKKVCCPHCSRYFKKSIIFKHMKLHQVKCPICQSVQATKEILKEHIKTNHPDNIE